MTTDRSPGPVEWALLVLDAASGIDAMRARAERAEAEVFRLQGELLRSPAGKLQALTAEVDELRKDAERYRWLRDTPWTDDCEIAPVIQMQMNAQWDTAIDAAMAVEVGHV